jgi:hypothetical protein
MSGQGKLILGQRFIEPTDGCDVKTYTQYVNRTLSEQVTFDEVRDLLGHYGCGIEELVDKIVADKCGIVKPSRCRQRR